MNPGHGRQNELQTLLQRLLYIARGRVFLNAPCNEFLVFQVPLQNIDLMRSEVIAFYRLDTTPEPHCALDVL